jgi:hypothetical protein
VDIGGDRVGGCARLDRHVGADLLEYLLSGALHEFDAERLKNSTALLYSDLLRQGDGNVDLRTNVTISVTALGDVRVPILAVKKDGEQFAIALSGPLTTDHPAEPSVRELGKKTNDIQIIVINELLVRGNLPAATREVQRFLGL